MHVVNTRSYIEEMVVFTCGHCGESVQKPKVEKHYLTKCRNRSPNLSCMDCFKDFIGNAYETHTKCITEEQRYSGKGFQAKEKKGEKKQTAWVEMVQSVLDEQKNAPASVRRIIEAISKHQNTPRKKPKFINFVKNVCGPKTNPKDIDQAWDMISVKLAALSNANNQNKNQNLKNGASDANVNAKEESDENCVVDSVDKENGHTNGHVATQDVNKENHENGNAEGNDEKGQVENNDKKLSKKQRKEEKKRKKYEAELQSAEVVPEELEDETTQVNNKKGKKKKNKSECSNGDVEEVQAEGKNGKNKKRKRQDTTNSVPEIIENVPLETENIPAVKEKTVKKKLKVDENEDADESICLHDQNVAKIEELSMKGDKFNWHATIMTVLEKKGEMPFKRLQKKVLSEYSEATGREVDDRIADKFIKKLKSAPQVRVDKNRVYIEE